MTFPEQNTSLQFKYLGLHLCRQLLSCVLSSYVVIKRLKTYNAPFQFLRLLVHTFPRLPKPR